jgi:hypothetical protein
MRTAPTFHTRYLQGENQTTGGKLRVASQLLKYWSQLRSTTTGISSFHLEMLLASEKICTGVISYRTILALAFQSLASRKCAALRDPIGVAGLIPLIGSPGKRALAYTAVLSAAAHARNAVMCEQEQNSREAYRQWDIVFNHMLPR